MPDTQRPMIEISGVNKYFDDYHALRNINLEIDRVSDASFWYRCSGDSVLSCSG